MQLPRPMFPRNVFLLASSLPFVAFSRTYAKLFQQGAPTRTVRVVRQGGATPL